MAILRKASAAPADKLDFKDAARCPMAETAPDANKSYSVLLATNLLVKGWSLQNRSA